MKTLVTIFFTGLLFITCTSAQTTKPAGVSPPANFTAEEDHQNMLLGRRRRRSDWIDGVGGEASRRLVEERRGVLQFRYDAAGGDAFAGDAVA